MGADALFLAAAAVAASQIVLFPGNVKSVNAPDGSGARIYYRQHMVPGVVRPAQSFMMMATDTNSVLELLVAASV